MRVSVVMPSLNQRGFIGAAVRSVLAQQGVDELVVVDGGSSDGTLSELAALAAQRPGWLRWLSGPDDGPAQAVNRAVAMARGDVIGWLNSDDLYATGAVERAVAYLMAVPECAMVYGEGELVDACGATMGRYPTRPPSTPASEFAHGCFICQPTAFFRRSAFDAIGGLDESLRAAFDFDAWIRLFKAFPDRVGFVPQVQAHSRLHASSITSSQRERVALEGMAVVRRHLGPAPPEWLLTHFAERCQTHPFDAAPTDLRKNLEVLIARARPSLSDDGYRQLLRRVQSDRSLLLATSNVFACIHPDGWAPPVLELRIRQPEAPARRLLLQGRHARPGDGALRLTVLQPDGLLQVQDVPANGPFEMNVMLTDCRPDARIVLQVKSAGGFVPAHCEPGSMDTRELAFLVESIALES